MNGQNVKLRRIRVIMQNSVAAVMNYSVSSTEVTMTIKSSGSLQTTVERYTMRALGTVKKAEGAMCMSNRGNTNDTAERGNLLLQK